MSAFPTLRLPYLPAKDVVNEMDIDDLNSLFLCSKKARKFLRAFRRPVSFVALSSEQKESLDVLEIIEYFRQDNLAGKFLEGYEIVVDIKVANDIGFRINAVFPDGVYLHFHVYAECIDQQDQYNGTKSFLKIGGVYVPVVMKKKYEMYTFWDCKQRGFKTIGEYLGQKISPDNRSYLNIDGDGRKQEYSENLRFILNWMNSTNGIPQNCSIGGNSDDKINEDDFKFILDNVHPMEKFNIYTRLSNEFQEFQHNTIFKAKNLYLSHANWFSLENLLQTDCQYIDLGKSKLTNYDLNEYLKHLMELEFSKLKNLQVEIKEDLNIDIILSGFEDSPRYKITRKDNSVQIERNDGVKTKISTRGKIASKAFEMKSWWNN